MIHQGEDMAVKMDMTYQVALVTANTVSPGSEANPPLQGNMKYSFYMYLH